jgi:hypothetical protein
MIRARRPVRRIATVCLLFAARESPGQDLSSTSGASLSITTPSEADYDAGASLPTANYAITTSCTGTLSSGCRLFIQYGSNPQGQQVDLEYAILSLTADCLGAVANANTWYAVNPVTTVLSTNKNKTCVAAFSFRVGPLSYALHTSPAPNGAYRQQARFVLTRP